MRDASSERLLWRTMERLDAVERLLLNPEPSGLGALVENLDACWGELCAMEHAVRAGGATSGWRAELEEVRARVSRLSMLLDHARAMVSGWQMVSGGAYGENGVLNPVDGAVLRRVDEEG